MPNTSATAERRPSDPILPRPVKENTCRGVPRIEARMFCAQVRACRSACCAVGGENMPSTCGTWAQSPSAHTPGASGTAMPLSTLMRPFSCASGNMLSMGCGPAGTVATQVRVRILSISFVFEFSMTTESALTAFRLRPS